MTITLRYWGVRGVAEPSRYLLRYSGADWEDVQISLTASAWGDWMNEKFTHGLDFPNLPYLIDGDIKISQSVAVIRYLGRKFNLAPITEAEIIRSDMAEQEIMDLRVAFGRLCYNPDFDNLKAAYLDNLTGKLEVMAQFIGDGPWLMGEKISYIDFLGYEVFDQIKKLTPEHFKEGKIAEYMAGFEALPQLKAWFSSAEYKEGKFINSPQAMFRGK